MHDVYVCVDKRFFPNNGNSKKGISSLWILRYCDQCLGVLVSKPRRAKIEYSDTDSKKEEYIRGEELSGGEPGKGRV